MAVKREIAALVPVLIDEENQNRSPEEVAELAIAALDEVRAKHNRLAVIGQFTWGPETPHTVVLGPFSTRGLAVAREQGARLSVPGSQPGEGRFMLVPAFTTARAAREHFKPADELSERRLAKLLADVYRWAPGLWAQEMSAGPVCRCGVRRIDRRDTGLCEVHGKESA